MIVGRHVDLILAFDNYLYFGSLWCTELYERVVIIRDVWTPGVKILIYVSNKKGCFVRMHSIPSSSS